MADYAYTTVKVTVDDGVAKLVLNIPETGNAINGTMHDEITDAFYELNADPAARVIVLTGSGNNFCSGGDPSYIRDLEPADFNEVFLTVRRLTQNILALDKPLIGALNGDAIGVGATLAVYCDMVIAAEVATSQTRMCSSASPQGTAERSCGRSRWASPGPSTSS
jgi:enoyl-CoA hydratase